jgi:hypothetical protein
VKRGAENQMVFDETKWFFNKTKWFSFFTILHFDEFCSTRCFEFFEFCFHNFFLKNSNLTGRFSQKSASFQTVFQSMGLTGEG